MEYTNRMQKCRAKLKTDPVKWQLHLEKERERDKKRREAKKRSLNRDSLALKRQKDAERQRKCRERKQIKKVVELNEIQMPSTSHLGSFRSKRSLTRAISKTKKSLPVSPSKKEAVIKQLAAEILPSKLSIQLFPSSGRKKEILTAGDIDLVRTFYQRDDISRQAPGIKEWKSIKDPQTGKRARVQKRHMIMSISEAFTLFKEEHDIQIGKSKFYSLRPENVRPVIEMPHNICVCIYHANFSFLLEAASTFISNVSSDYQQLLKNLCCDTESEVCMTTNCGACFSFEDILPLKFNENNSEIIWKQWKHNKNRVKLETLKGSPIQITAEIDNQLLNFKTHCFVLKSQMKYFHERRTNLAESEAVLQIDFAENFAIVSQDEIQSAHWQYSQVTVFTGCAWMTNNHGSVQSYSFAILSDELAHDKYSVWMFLKTIITDLKNIKPLEKITIFSDGCTGQFKNKYNLYNLCTASEDFGVEVEWSFFPTSHGKGAVDGIGAVTKRTLWTAIKARSVVINTPEECYRFLVKQKSSIRYLFVAKEDITEKKEFLEQRWSDVHSIPKIRTKHVFRAQGSTQVLASRTAFSVFEEFNVK